MSPAQKLYGHLIQDTLPAHRRAFAPEWQRDPIEAEQQAFNVQEAVEEVYNRRAQILPEIIIRSKVALQNHETKRWDRYGTIADIGPHRQTSSRHRVDMSYSETDGSSDGTLLCLHPLAMTLKGQISFISPNYLDDHLVMGRHHAASLKK